MATTLVTRGSVSSPSTAAAGYAPDNDEVDAMSSKDVERVLEPKCGKTTLVQAFLDELAEHEVTCAQGQYVEQGNAIERAILRGRSSMES
jgi:hypothetical protein